MSKKTTSSLLYKVKDHMNLSDFSGRSRNGDLSRPLVLASKEDLAHQPSPFIPTSLRSFKGMSYVPLYIQSLRDNPLYEQSTGNQFKVAISLYMAAWESETACSIPNSLPQLAKLVNLDTDSFVQCMKEGSLKNGFMHGWILCSNNRFYQPELARAMATTMNRFAEKQFQMEKARYKKECQRRQAPPEEIERNMPELKLLAYQANQDDLPIFKVIKPEMLNGRVKCPEDFNFVDGWEKLLERHPFNENSMRAMGDSLFDSDEPDEEVHSACPSHMEETSYFVPGTNPSVLETPTPCPKERIDSLDDSLTSLWDISLKDKGKEKEKEKDKEKKYQQRRMPVSKEYDLTDDLVVENLMSQNGCNLSASAIEKARGELVLPQSVPAECFRSLDLRSFWEDLGKIGFQDPVKNRMEFPESVLQDLKDLSVNKVVIDRAYEILVQSYGRTQSQTVALFKKILVNFVANLGTVIGELRFFSEDLSMRILRLPMPTILELDKIIKRDRREAASIIRMYCEEEESLRKAIWAASNIEKGRISVCEDSTRNPNYNPLLHLGGLDK